MPPVKRTNPNDPPPILAEAIRLYDYGLWVVPCNGKKPIWGDWPTVRRGPDELAAALAKKPLLNIGIALNQTDYIDVECDTDGAEAALQGWFGGNVPPTPTWRSKRGLHRLFRRPPGLPEKAKVELDGVELRIGHGKGALSVVPPSVHPDGHRYKWLPELALSDVEPAELPPEIVQRLQAPVPLPSSISAGDEIREGKRNDTLYKKARQLHGMGLPAETTEAALLDLNRRLCNPPLPESEVRAIAASAAKSDAKADPGLDAFAARLLTEVEVWHDETDEPFMTLSRGDHRENWPIGKKSKSFHRWLSKRYHETTGKVLGASGVADLAAILEGKAVFEGPMHAVYRRVAEHDGRFYLDLCDDQWRCVEITADGWEVGSNPPVKFRRAKAMHPLPVPERSDSSLKDLLLPFLNVTDDQWPLVAAWLAAALRPTGPYPLLKLLGEQGSAKTTTARVLRQLVDPNAAPVRAEPRDGRDLMIAATNAWVLCFDNLSVVKSDLSDALCRLSTGGGYATRALFTDDEETIFDAQRPIILTSIEDIGPRLDLLERSLILDLPTIPEGDRRTEKAFWADFEATRPWILGALLDVVSGALRRLPEVERRPGSELSRMADFEQWGEAVEEPLGLAPGTFAAAYRANREAATQIALESSPVVTALLEMVEARRSIEYTARELLQELDMLHLDAKRSPGWPKTPRVLSQILRRVAPNLRQVGIVAVQDTRGSGSDKRNVWRIAMAEAADTAPTTPKRISVPSGPFAPTPRRPSGITSGLKASGRTGRRKADRRPRRTRRSPRPPRSRSRPPRNGGRHSRRGVIPRPLPRPDRDYRRGVIGSGNRVPSSRRVPRYRPRLGLYTRS